MAHVFISYKREDKDFAFELKDQLEGFGFQVWIDKDIPPGRKWREEIDEKLSQSFAVALVVTSEAMKSQYVTYEWTFALGSNSEVIPIYLKEIERFPYRLEDIQYIDFRKSYKWGELFRLISAVRERKSIPNAVSQAIANFDSPDSNIRISAIKTLDQNDHPAATEALVQATKHSTKDVRLEAASALANRVDFDDSSILPSLIEAYWAEKLSLSGRVHTLRLIGKYKFAQGLEIALRGFQDNQPATQITGAEALDQIFAPQVVQTLLKVERNNLYENSENLATKLIQNHRTEALPELIKALDTDDREIQQTAMNEIGYYNAHTQLPTINELEKFLFDENTSSRLREMVLHVLKNIPAESARAVVTRWKQTQNEN